MDRPTVWQMITDAIEKLNGEVAYSEIKEYLKEKWNYDKPATINDQIAVMTVNHQSRIHYQENNKPRLTNTNSHFDLLYTTGRGKVVKYNPERHGVWEIYRDSNHRLGVRLYAENSSVNTYLFVWNPEKWNWTTLEQSIEHLENSGKVTERWSCRSHKVVKPGDRAFLAKVGSSGRGIFASGYIASPSFLDKHWSGEDKNLFHVYIDFDVLLNPDKEPYLTLDLLKTGNLAKQQWTPQASGISIRPELVEELESVWFNFLTTQKIRRNPYTLAESEIQRTFTEGTASQVMQTRYERNPHARAACIKHYGHVCTVCNFNFEKYYGQLGKNFIHVHHLKLVASVGETYKVDPIKDLRPVCPNCHAMLHKETPPLAIDYLKSLISSS